MITFRQISPFSISWVHLVKSAIRIGRARRPANVGARLPFRKTLRHCDDTPLNASAPCINGVLIVIVGPSISSHNVLDC
jgi:hypothetical protein